MVERAKRRALTWAPGLIIAAIALLSVGTISNQLRINDANTRLTTQAQNGQRALTRQCALVPVGRKLYTGALKRGEITDADFALVVSSAEQACRK